MLKEYIIDNWGSFTGADAPASLQIAPLSSCGYDYGNDIVLLFVDDGLCPEYVMKISRGKNYGFKLENEYSALRSLAAVEKLRPYIPHASYKGELGGSIFFIQKGVPGESLMKVIRKKGTGGMVVDLLNKAVELLVSINTAGKTPGKQTNCNRMGELDRYMSMLSEMGIDRAEVEGLKRDMQSDFDMDGKYFLHGDYWQSNIMVEGGDIKGIIDWEFAFPDSNVPSDIVWFLINLAHCLSLRDYPSSTISESFQRAFFCRWHHNYLLHELYGKYCDGIGLEKDSFGAFLKMTLIYMSFREFYAYGRHSDMDSVCFDMLRYLIVHESDLVLR